jgi:uncharacterized protein
VKLPIKINPFELCDHGAVLEGTLPVKQLTRLTELLANTEGDVSVRLEFSRDKHGQRLIQGQIGATLMLTCQRCGNAISCDINLMPKLCPVMDDTSARLPADFEPLLVVDEDGLVLMADLVEEEVLLSLPMIPKHEQGKCPVKLPDYIK